MKKSIIHQCAQIAFKKNTPETHPEWGNWHHFAFIIQNNKVVGWATNRTGEPLVYFGYNEKTKIHAEYAAYSKVKGILDKNKPFSCVNIRLNKENEMKMSKPCVCCANVLQSVGCKEVVFSTEVGFATIKL